MKAFIIKLCICLFTCLLLIFIYNHPLFRQLELLSLDLRFNLARNISPEPRIVIIEISDSDIAEVGSWPWPRSWHATLTKILSEQGAKAIAFDILFTEKTDEFNDISFQQAIKNAGNVYLPFAFQFKEGGFDLEKRFEVIKEFKDYIKGSGFINVIPDSDGVIRRIRLLIKDDKNNTYLHFAFKIAQDILGLDKSVNIPLDKENNFIINWSGRWKGTFKHYSYLDIVRSYALLQENKPPVLDLNEFKDKICLAGVTATGLYDIKPTPLESLYPAVGINAQIINSILKERFIYPASQWLNILLVFLLGFIGSIFVLRLFPLRGLIFNFIAVGLYLLVNFLIFRFKGYYLNLVLPLASNFICYFSVATYQQVANILERKRLMGLAITDGLTGLFNIRYFRTLLEEELRNIQEGKAKTFSLIMCDIDHFKNINDTYGHHIGDMVLKEVALVLKESLRSSDIIARYGGEEMIIMLKDTNLDTAVSVAEKIRSNIEEHRILIQANSYAVTASFGVVEFRENDEFESLINRVDVAMYKAKQAGRNKVCTMG